MAPSEVEVDESLAAQVAALAAARGETVEEVVARALRAYIDAPKGDDPPQR